MAQRFSRITSLLIQKGLSFDLLTTRSLASEFGFEELRSVKSIDDLAPRLGLRDAVLIASTLLRILLRQYRRVHLAGAGRLTEVIIALCKVSKTPVSCTFASRTIDMASYGREADKKRWEHILNRVDKIDVLNPGHDLHKWSAKISVSPCSFVSKQNTLPKTYLAERESLVVFCGALEQTKNPKLAIEIVDLFARTTGIPAKLVIFGKGSEEDAIDALMREVNAWHRRELVSFGASSELGNTLSRANVFLSLQEIDNYPSQSLLEAMLMGCKVVATDEGDTHLLLPTSEHRNRLVKSRRANDFMEAMHIAFSDNFASTVNAEFVARHHNVDRFSEYFIEFLDA